MAIIVFVISIILATIILRAFPSLFMSIIGAKVMFVSVKLQLAAIFVVTLFMSVFIFTLFGVIKLNSPPGESNLLSPGGLLYLAKT